MATIDLTFRSTRPHGARHARLAYSRVRCPFRSTRPHGARRVSKPSANWFLGFDPRARMGRDHGMGCDRGWNGVSIHAPAWGATGNTLEIAKRRIVSIHAPAWGATEYVL